MLLFYRYVSDILISYRHFIYFYANYLFMNTITKLLFSVLVLCTSYNFAQHSVAREWNDEILEAIRSDYARPTVHARNLFHTSAIMYDAWAIFDTQAEPVFLGKTFDGFTINFNGIATPTDLAAARHEIISYALFRLLQHRFQNSPNYDTATNPSLLSRFQGYGYDVNFTSTEYSSGSYAALGNYMASQMIAFGLQDNSNEINLYNNVNYLPSNDPLILELYEDNTGINPDVWQPLAFDVFIGQGGNTFPLDTPDFLSPEWGLVSPFCLVPEDLNIYNDPGYDCYVYNDPGPPVYIQNSNEDGIDDPYKWHFALVAAWSSHMAPPKDPNNPNIEVPVMIDISPASIGNFNLQDLPETFEEYKAFYDFFNGGDASAGHTVNPSTGLPYVPQLVKRSDYARVLAEFWADGPTSETPPGHWFTILNYVSDHPLVEKKMNGQGPVLSDLEWDVKCYLALAGAMHDSAVDVWGIKGYYDYIRPISAIRYMAGKGQSSDATLPSYDPHGLPLIPEYIELIDATDPIRGDSNENVGKVKIFAWKGPDYITDPETDLAGVDWIIGDHWWPYQRGTFVTPPFAGYVSGHSTFSRAAAEMLTLLTGDKFFPGGMGTFEIEQNNFLVFEPGPSENMTLQWATYQDASDQTSLSRIWGGIHPPIDDIRGRIIGEKIGVDAYNLAVSYFDGALSTESFENDPSITVYPNPFSDVLQISNTEQAQLDVQIYSVDGKLVLESAIQADSQSVSISTESLSSGLYFAKIKNLTKKTSTVKKVIKN